jgi:hypothetical protein
LETVLSISSLGFPIFSARGCTQTLEPIAQDHHFFRNIHGDLIFNGSHSKKYKTRIQCKDHYPPATDQLRIGDMVEVSCISILSQTYTGNSVQNLSVPLQKKPVLGSIHISSGDAEIPFEWDGKSLIFTCSFERILISYRPILIMRFLGYSFSTLEWDMKTEWSMTFEEV